MTIRIAYDQNTQLSKMLAQAVNDILEARVSALRVQKILDMAQWGSPADWNAVAAELGLTGAAAATDAQALYSIFSAATAQLDVDAIRIELGRLDQG